MKKMLLLLFLLLAGCAAQSPRQAGMDHVMAEQVMKVHADKDTLDLHDFLVTFKRLQAESGAETLLQFELDKNGEAMKLQPLHEKLMHLILVRKDLRYFDHVHPVRDGKIFSAPYTFLAPGEYHMWIEFSNGTLEHIIDYSLNVTGEQISGEPEQLGNLSIEFNPPILKQDTPARLDFIITDKNGKEVPITEPFLGAAAHLIIVDKTLQEFTHAHDETLGGNLLSFEYTPEKSGNYSTWIEFNYAGQQRRTNFNFNVI